MQAWKWAAALLLVALGSPAQAASYAWCRMSGGNYESYLSAIVEIGDGREAYRAFLAGPFGEAFRDHVRAAFDPGASSLHCTREDSLLFANDHIAVLINANPGIKFVQTGWRGPRRAAAGADPPRRSAKAVAAAPPTETKAAAPKQADAAPAKKPWELEYERKLAAYEQELARQRQAVRDYERGQAATAAMKAELRARAEKAQAEWQAAVAACRAGDRSACSGVSRP